MSRLFCFRTPRFAKVCCKIRFEGYEKKAASQKETEITEET